VVIGNGNVALDVARMLALTPQELQPTDTTDEAIEAINAAAVREIVVVGRRGPVQAAWTPVEVGELGDLGGADILVDPAELELDPASEVELEAAPQTVKRNVEHLRSYAARAPEGRPRAIRLRFLRSPVAILGEEKVEAIELVRNELVDGRAVATDDREVIECGIVFRSVGYRGIPLPGVPFDEGSCTVPNDGGRVSDATGAAVPGAYCAGWIKRGPTGVIGTNKKDATETVELLLEDARGGRLGRGEPAAAMDEVLEERGVAVVTQTGWQAIDTAERAAGELQGRPRVKLAEWDALLDAAGHKPASH
jgi:ferredoxin--NADP+ reductase